MLILGNGRSTGGLFSVALEVMAQCRAWCRRNPWGVVTRVESREHRGQADDKGRSRLDAAVASWLRPIVQADYRDSGSGGKSTDPSPRSPRTSDHDATLTRATGSFRTIARPTGSKAGTGASLALAPS